MDKTQQELIVPRSFAEFFLIEFTKELIKNSGEQISQLKRIIKEETKREETKKEISKNKIPTPPTPIVISKKPPIKLIRVIPPPPLPLTQIPLPPSPSIIKPMAPARKIERTGILRIPEPRLPLRFQYLKPYPTKREIDLGRLNSLIKDPFVEIIECNGSYDPIVVRGSMGRKPTNIFLEQEEIGDTIRKFSAVSKIPIHTGIYRVIVGRLILLAIISDVISSKFIIKKMRYNIQNPRYNPNNSQLIPHPQISFNANQQNSPSFNKSNSL